MFLDKLDNKTKEDRSRGYPLYHSRLRRCLSASRSTRAKPRTYTLAVVANFATDYKEDREFTRQAIQMLLDARTEKDEQVWWSAEETSVYATGPSAAVETTGLAVQALLQSGEASGTARKALSYIASKKDAYGTWGTTQATIMALRALLTATEKRCGRRTRHGGRAAER